MKILLDPPRLCQGHVKLPKLHGRTDLLTRYAGMGYNALQANPEGDFYSGGIDPGIKTTRLIFKHTYSDGKRTFYRE